MAPYPNFTWCTYIDGSNCTSNATLYDDDDADASFDDGFESSMVDYEYVRFREMSRFWVKQMLYPLIMCVGVIGNGITIVILTRRRMRSSTNHYLTALAFSDLFYLIFAFTLNLDHYDAMRTHAYFSYRRYALMLTDACSNASVWLTVTFTIERYVAVCHPIKGKVFCTQSRAKKVILVVVVLCLLVTLPTPFEWSVVERSDPVTNATRFDATQSELGRDETFRRAYNGFITVCFVFLPLFLLAVFNSFLIRSVHQSKTQRRRMTMRGHRNDSAHQEYRITVMLIAVVVMFLLCQLPTAGVLVYTSIHTLDGRPNAYAVVLGLGNIFNFLVAVNAACNFILYCAFSDKYRRTFLRTFVPCLYRRGSPNHSQSNVTAAYTQSEIDSIGGSFRRRRSSKRSTVRRNSAAKPHANGNGRANAVVPNGIHLNGHGVNGAVKPKNHRLHYLQVPLDDGVGSPAAKETAVNGNGAVGELTIVPAADGKSAVVAYHHGSSSSSPPASSDRCRPFHHARPRNYGFGSENEFVVSVTPPDGSDRLL